VVNLNSLKRARTALNMKNGSVERYPMITVAVGDGGTGKTPVSYMIASWLESLVLTNDGGILDGMKHKGFKQEELVSIGTLAPAVTASMPLTVDMGGYAENGAVEIFKMSDVVICPIDLDSFGVERAFASIEAIAKYAKKIVIIVTRSDSKVKVKVDDELTLNGELDIVRFRTSHINNIDAYFEIKRTNIFNTAIAKKIGVTDLWRGENRGSRGTYGLKKGMKKGSSIIEQIELIENYIKEI
jgi:hypothetical protein